MRNDFTNRLMKANIHRLNVMQSEEFAPCERAFHCAEKYGNKLIVYGGHKNAIYEDYLIFNTTEHSWTPEPPPIRGRSPNKR
jgi:hypothetical protein